MWYNNNRNGEGITPKNQKGINTMRKMIIANERRTVYKPCLDGRDVRTTNEIMKEIAVSAARGDVSTVRTLATHLINSEEHNNRANRNECFIHGICKFIVENVINGDVLCEAETFQDVFMNRKKIENLDGRTSDDTSLFILTRAALYRLTEAGVLEKSKATVYEEGEGEWTAKPRVIYIVKNV